MRQNARNVLTAFAAGCSLNEKTISTDGKELYSYAMKIARKAPDGRVLALDVAAPSATTSSHMRAVLAFFPDAILVEELE